MDKEKFAGVWKLISVEYLSEDGEVNYQVGREPIGRLIYDSKENVSVHIFDVRRPKFASNDCLKGTPEEIKSAFEGSRCYFGTYEVDEKRKVVTHHVQGSIYPNLIGVDNDRYYDFSGNCLTLRTGLIMMGGKKVVGKVVWERL